jgi:hypothetical protein
VAVLLLCLLRTDSPDSWDFLTKLARTKLGTFVPLHLCAYDDQKSRNPRLRQREQKSKSGFMLQGLLICTYMPSRRASSNCPTPSPQTPIRFALPESSSLHLLRACRQFLSSGACVFLLTCLPSTCAGTYPHSDEEDSQDSATGPVLAPPRAGRLHFFFLFLFLGSRDLGFGTMLMHAACPDDVHNRLCSWRTRPS